MIRFLVLIFLLLPPLLLPGAAYAERPGLGLDTFAAIPVLHEGRIKPLESFAAVTLRQLAKGEKTPPPAAWLAEALFNPQQGVKRRIFKITNADVRARLNLPERPGRLYSLEELAPGLGATEQQARALAASVNDHLTPDQKALVALHEDALTLAQILNAMSALLPLDMEVTAGLEAIKSGVPITYLDLRRQEQALLRDAAALFARKGDNLETYSDAEKNLIRLSLAYDRIRENGAHNFLLRVMPPQWGESAEWLAPWALLQTGQGSPESAALLGHWQAMANAYHNNDAAAWQDAAQKIHTETIAQSRDMRLAARLETEKIYNALSPFKLAFGLYALALLLAALHCYRPRRALYISALLALGAGALTHAAGIIMRVIILQRAPVGSLYESLLFVSLMIALAGLALALSRRDGLALTGAAAASLLILFIAPAIAPAGDDLEVLVAVLNTNFWLSTHVLCITAGYGFCILTAMLAHIWLFRAGSGKSAQEGLTRNIYILSLIALLLTATGTVLGGIWADQSWGRFWGWDPKENGALLIVLWLVWLHHGRLGGHLAMPAFQAGMAALNIIVALAWFGVNLLSVGLHSYGFISGIASGLAAFCTLEIVVIGGLYYRLKQKRVAA